METLNKPGLENEIYSYIKNNPSNDLVDIVGEFCHHHGDIVLDIVSVLINKQVVERRPLAGVSYGYFII